MAPASRTKPVSPQTYTPKHLAEQILTSKSALQGERKQVTVLFADLKGSMELLADRDPEESRTLLNAVVERMMEAVHRYEGTVNNVMGDGIMAIFGAPLALEDHALRACYAALAMQDTIQRYNDEVRGSLGITVRIRVGLNSGEVVVGNIGNDLHMDYNAVGQTTHLASRMEQLAPPGGIHLTNNTLRLVEGFVEVKSIGPVPVKGLADPVEVFDLVGAGSTRKRLQVLAAKGLTRFVGRHAELETLASALGDAHNGHGQVVAVVGEPGVGKSRLFWEFSHSHRTDDWLILESGSVSYGKASAYRPVVDLLKAYFRVEAREDERQIREKITGKLLTLDRSLEPTLPAFFSLLDLPVEDSQWNSYDPPKRRLQTLDALKSLVFRESQVQPLCLVFEDLHWIDSETQAFLDSLIESLPSARLLLLVNYRPEYQHGWASKSYYAQIRVDPLPPESAQELLNSLLGDSSEVTPLRKLLVERTEGNPFFLEESVQTLVEDSVLVGQRGNYRLDKPLESITVPATVQAVLTARIDRLSPEAKRLLQTAAVLGKDVEFEVLQLITDETQEELRHNLNQLQAAEFLYETQIFPKLEYTFKHALTHEVAYGSLLVERRRDLHAKVVHAIEQLYSERLIEQVERLGHHAFRGEKWSSAASYFHQAGNKTAARSAHREALGHFEQALEALSRMPAGRETTEKEIDIRVAMRIVLLPLREFQKILEHLDRAETLAKDLGDRHRLGWVSVNKMIYLWVMADNERAAELGEQGVAIAAESDDFALRIVASTYLGAVYFAMGEYAQAVDLLQWTTKSLQGDQSYERFGQVAPPFVLARNWLACCLAELGQFADGSTVGEEAVQVAEKLDHPFSLINAYFGLGHVYVRQGDFERAIPLLESALFYSQSADIPVWYGPVASHLGYAYVVSGRYEEGVSLLEQAVKSRMFCQLLGFIYLGESRIITSQADDTIALAKQTVALTDSNRESGHHAWALRLMGDVYAQQGASSLDESARHYHGALSEADNRGMRPLQAHCHLGLGKLYMSNGKHREGEEHLSQAAKLFSAMDMKLWLSTTEEAQRSPH